ncbi:pilin [Candidatus Parcubacteria bacterium]|nr:pilin [Candidatus Parcubacteria bacterium]
MHSNTLKKLFLAYIIVLSTFSFVSKVYAASPCDPSKGYCLLAPIPLGGANEPETTQVTDFKNYIPGVIKLVIGLAGALAVLMIVIGGFQYISSATIGGKTSGRDTIKNAVTGLLLAISSWVILNTLNPNLVKFDLTLATLPTGPVIDTGLANPTTPTTPTTNTCTNCVALTGVPAKPPGQGCAGTDPCQVNSTLALKLQELARALEGKITWQVNEMYPPTVKHNDPCHSNGTCVDAGVIAPTTGRIIIFLTAISKLGVNFEYETCDQQRLASLRNDPQLSQFKDKFKCEPTSVGEAAHIEL